MLRVAYFSNGLVQPPTRYRSWAKQTMNSFWRAFEDVRLMVQQSGWHGLGCAKIILHKIANDCKVAGLPDLFHHFCPLWQDFFRPSKMAFSRGLERPRNL